MSPRIIAIHGSTSSGKSTLVEALQESLLPEVWLAFSVDTMIYSLPNTILDRCNNYNDWTGVDWTAIFTGAITSLRSLVEAGNNVIFDAVISSQIDSEKLHLALADIDVFTVGLHCDISVVEQRTIARSDRTLDEAMTSFKTGLKFISPDMILDSSSSTPIQLANKIINNDQLQSNET